MASVAQNPQQLAAELAAAKQGSKRSVQPQQPNTGDQRDPAKRPFWMRNQAPQQPTAPGQQQPQQQKQQQPQKQRSAPTQMLNNLRYRQKIKKLQQEIQTRTKKAQEIQGQIKKLKKEIAPVERQETWFKKQKTILTILIVVLILTVIFAPASIPINLYKKNVKTKIQSLQERLKQPREKIKTLEGDLKTTNEEAEQKRNEIKQLQHQSLFNRQR